MAGDKMSNAENTDPSPPKDQLAKRGFWQSAKRVFIRTEAELSYFKGLTFFGLISTLVVAYFQNLSTYHDKVATMAKQDMAAATEAFTDASTALSVALSLQQRLISDFYAAVPGDTYKNDAAYLTKDARATYKDYADMYSKLHQNYNLLARKTEIYLDWASNAHRDPAANTSPTTDPINMSLLGEFDFDCEKYMPSFDSGKTTVTLPDPHHSKDTLVIDWNSAKHHALTTEYCFDVTHKGMTAVLQWGSQTNIDLAQMSYMTNPDRTKLFKTTRATGQVLRLNAFMSLAMFEIEQIRVKYRPNGFICSVPGVGQLSSLFNRCTPVRTASP
jgi:hypothetical protein